MKVALANEDLLWGVLCMAQQRRFPMRLLVDFWWMQRGSVCGAKERFGTTRRRVELELTRMIAFSDIDGVTIADLDSDDHTAMLSGGGIAMCRRHLKLVGVYRARGNALRKLADEFDVYVLSQSGSPDSAARTW